MNIKAIFTILFLNLLIQNTFAHNPISTKTIPDSYGTAIKIENPEISRVYYSEINISNPQTWFVFEGKKGVEVFLNIGVPVIERLRFFQPEGALIGPGFEYMDIGFDIPPGNGVFILNTMQEPRFFHEEFTGTDSWIYLEQTVVLPESGTYYFVAFPKTAMPLVPKLWMAIGTKERFGIKELFTFGAIKKSVRNFHEIK